MNLIPENNLKPSLGLNLAPMIDFLFLMLSMFATLAVTRATLFDTQLDLVKLKKEPNAQMVYTKDEIAQINLSISKKGSYKWITEIQDYPMETVEKIQNEIFHHYNIGALPKDKTKTQVLLHIDRKAPWEPIAKLIFAVRETGFEALPIYKPEDGSK
jgi:biopolymer transport protein ExbD